MEVRGWIDSGGMYLLVNQERVRSKPKPTPVFSLLLLLSALRHTADILEDRLVSAR